MKTPLLSLSLCLLISIQLTGQPHNAFSYISKPSELEQEMEALVGPKYEKALAIYNKLVETKGDRRFPVPAFAMTKAANNAAYLVYGGTQIGLEEKAYDICMSMGEEEGEAAVAGLLGHELVHFYEKHQWRSSFAKAYQELEIGRTLEGMVDQDKINNETQADYLGGFLAYSAGYPVFENRAAVLQKIYDQYPFPKVDTTGAYPSLEDRQALAVKSEEKLKDLVTIFEVGNLLAAIGKYEEARVFYRHILIDYQGREIYNNLGVITVLESLEYFPESDRKLRLPLELDMTFGAGSKEGFANTVERRQKLLKEAITYFKNAISMDPEYAPAYLNIACAYYMLEDNERATFYAGTEAQRNPERYPKTVKDAKVLLAMLKARDGNTAAAIKDLEQISEPTAVASFNLAKLKGESGPASRKPDGPDAYDIDDVAPYDLTSFDRQYRTQRREIELFDVMDFRIWTPDAVPALKNSTVYMIKSPDSPRVYLHLTATNNKGELYDGFKTGTKRSELVAYYGEPKTSLEMPNGEMMVYKEVILLLDHKGQLSRWANYRFK